MSTRGETTDQLAESLTNIMAATLMDSSYQGEHLQTAAWKFANEIMEDWLWAQIKRKEE